MAGSCRVNRPCMSCRVNTRPLFDPHHVADQHLAHAASQRRRVIAHLVGMRKHHVLRAALVLDRVAAERRQNHLPCTARAADVPRESLCRRAWPRPPQPAFRSARRSTTAVMLSARAQPLRGGKRFPTDAFDLPAALLQNQKNTHRTRASVFSFSTSAAAASLAEPGKICVDFCFFGAEICSSTTVGATIHAELRRAHAFAVLLSWRA